MHPAEVAASMDAPSKFAQRTNRGFADATCNLVTAVMLPLEPNGYSNGTKGTRTVLFGNSPSKPDWIRSLRKAPKTIGTALFCWASTGLGAIEARTVLRIFHVGRARSRRLSNTVRPACRDSSSCLLRRFIFTPLARARPSLEKNFARRLPRPQTKRWFHGGNG